MAEGQVLIKDLLEATEVDDSAYLPIDDGELTKKISVENFNASSNQTAKAYAEAAAASAQTASDTVANINQKVDQAQGYANAAQTQAGYASTYADNAQTFAGNAQGYANTASGHATNAGASASAASASADASADNALLAQSWVEGNTGAREGENTNNARYWANKAQSAAQITIDDHLDPQSTNPVENRVIYNALNDMHTGGSNIEITTTQTSLYGKDVTISDGTTIVTETFDLTGKALFEGVLMTGDLTITSSDGTSTATGTLTVPYFGNYTKAIAFWQATIAVTTTTSQFNGLTVSAKKSGAVMGTATFSNGSATITVPEQGTYTLEVTLDWKTYTSSSFSVTEETTYNETIDGFIAPISLTTPTSEFYGQSISVTRNGVAVPVSLAFSNSGTASFTALDEGTYLFTLTYGGEPYTASVVVSAETTYSAVIKMWTATINITTASSQMQSQDIDVYKGSAKVATIAFNASGQASYLAHESGTYHFVCTVDGYPFTSADVVVSDETVYSTSITYFGATLNISTSSSDLYSQTITIKKGSTVVGTTAFSAQGSATYTVHETGTYTCECEEYSGSATVSAETTYSVTINAGLDLSAWITAGSTTDYPLNPSSYADFSALEADEAAVRQLMLVHDAVDYLATASAGDSLMQSVIGSDVCAKWINLSDYALDTLAANTNIKSVMDTADKYGYGEWGLVGQIPALSSNTASNGIVIYSRYRDDSNDHAYPYKAFDGVISGENGWYAVAGTIEPDTDYIGFNFDAPTAITEITIYCIRRKSVYVEASTDGTTWDKSFGAFDISQTPSGNLFNPDFAVFKLNNSTPYKAYRVRTKENTDSNAKVIELQFLAYQPLGNVPVMTSNNAPYGVASAYQVFDGNASTSASGTDFSYQSVNPICVRKFECSVSGGTLQGSNDGSTYTTISNPSTNTTYYMYHRVHFASSQTVHTLQFYGRELTVKQASAPTDGREYIQIGSNYYTEDWGEKEFATGSTRKTIYDHGVKPSGSLTATKTSNGTYEELPAMLRAKVSGSSTDSDYAGFYISNFDCTNYSLMCAKAGNIAYCSSPDAEGIMDICTSLSANNSYSVGRSVLRTGNNVFPDLDLSNINSSYIIFVGTMGYQAVTREATISEWWLE